MNTYQISEIVKAIETIKEQYKIGFKMHICGFSQNKIAEKNYSGCLKINDFNIFTKYRILLYYIKLFSAKFVLYQMICFTRNTEIIRTNN